MCWLDPVASDRIEVARVKAKIGELEINSL
jgi:hypothetical protein